MEPQLTIPSVPTAPKSFRRSKVLVVLAYIYLGIFCVQVILSLKGGLGLYSFPLMRIIFLLPSIGVLFAKNERLYRISRIIFSIQLLLVVVSLVAGILLFTSMW